MSITCKNIDEVIENTNRLINDKDFQNEIIENQKKYISKDTCEKITDVVIKELNIDRGNIQWKNISPKKTKK